MKKYNQHILEKATREEHQRINDILDRAKEKGNINNLSDEDKEILSNAGKIKEPEQPEFEESITIYKDLNNIPEDDFYKLKKLPIQDLINITQEHLEDNNIQYAWWTLSIIIYKINVEKNKTIIYEEDAEMIKTLITDIKNILTDPNNNYTINIIKL
mgnify:CR=1 FL=1